MATVDWQSQDGGDGMDEEVSTFEPPHISVKVKDPATEGSGYLQKYTVYTLTTKTTFAHFKSAESTVKRRYREFVLLQQAMAEKYPKIPMPDLPASRFAGRFDPEFIVERMSGLEDFINWVAQHPIMRKEKLVRLFLEVDTPMLSTDSSLSPMS